MCEMCVCVLVVMADICITNLAASPACKLNTIKFTKVGLQHWSKKSQKRNIFFEVPPNMQIIEQGHSFILLTGGRTLSRATNWASYIFILSSKYDLDLFMIINSDISSQRKEFYWQPATDKKIFLPADRPHWGVGESIGDIVSK